MSRLNPSPVERQLLRVRRRLFAQVLVNALAWAWAAALLLAGAWFLVQPYLIQEPREWLRWVIAGGLLALGTVVAAVFAFLRRPSHVEAALSLDSRFGLRERVTTSLLLAAHEQASPAGQALLADANQRVANLDVRSGFPLGLHWNAALIPLGALLLAVLAFFYHPQIGQAQAAKPDEELPPQDVARLQEKMKKLDRQVRKNKQEEKERSEKIKDFDEELDKLTIKPRKTKDQVKDLMKDATALEDRMQSHQKDVAERAQALKDQLKQIDKLGKKDPKDGPAKKLEKAIQEGKFDEAQEEIEKLAKKIKNNELTEKEKEQLEKQLQDIKEKVEKLTRQQEEIDKLEEMAKQGGPDAEELQRQLDEMKKNAQKIDKDTLKDLKDAADQLGQCQQCMKSGKGDQASDALKKAGSKLGKASGNDELQQLQEQLQQLRDAKQCMGQCAGGKPQPGAGRRPEDKDGETGRIDARQRADLGKGQLDIIGTEKGHNFKRPRKSSEIAGEIKQASQEAPEAIERLRIPKAAGDVTRGYFKNIREHAEKEQADRK
ncbi:MAG TPA: hypothetical protein VFA26_15275 [Gemmataceae bacterium]|nr:hypothetical protein [Gemmataceae bacterium]